MKANVTAELSEIRQIKPSDEDYPERVCELPGRPRVLRSLGDVGVLQTGPVLAVVGTRNANEDIRNSTRRLVEMRAEESAVLLDFLTRWVQNPRFTVRYRWTENTLAFWDNRCTQHFVLNDFEGERVIQRVTVMGDRPEGETPRWRPWVRDGRLSATSRHDRQLFLFLKSGQKGTQEQGAA